jgi:hypothetical protein
MSSIPDLQELRLSTVILHFLTGYKELTDKNKYTMKNVLYKYFGSILPFKW